MVTSLFEGGLGPPPPWPGTPKLAVSKNHFALTLAQPSLEKGEYRHAVNAFDKCHPYFLSKSSGDLRGCPFFDSQSKTNFMFMQLIEELTEDNAALRAQLATRQQAEKQQEALMKEVLDRMKAMYASNSHLTRFPPP